MGTLLSSSHAEPLGFTVHLLSVYLPSTQSLFFFSLFVLLELMWTEQVLLFQVIINPSASSHADPLGLI